MVEPGWPSGARCSLLGVTRPIASKETRTGAGREPSVACFVVACACRLLCARAICTHISDPTPPHPPGHPRRAVRRALLVRRRSAPTSSSRCSLARSARPACSRASGSRLVSVEFSGGKLASAKAATHVLAQYFSHRQRSNSTRARECEMQIDVPPSSTPFQSRVINSRTLDLLLVYFTQDTSTAPPTTRLPWCQPAI